jgi:iron complex transport system ATP-binding protein
MRAGALIARGAPDEVMTPEGLQAIYGIRMGVIPHPDATHLISFVQ